MYMYFTIKIDNKNKQKTFNFTYLYHSINLYKNLERFTVIISNYESGGSYHVQVRLLHYLRNTVHIEFKEVETFM